jgi:hypothetical protein
MASYLGCPSRSTLGFLNGGSRWVLGTRQVGGSARSAEFRAGEGSAGPPTAPGLEWMLTTLAVWPSDQENSATRTCYSCAWPPSQWLPPLWARADAFIHVRGGKRFSAGARNSPTAAPS